MGTSFKPLGGLVKAEEVGADTTLTRFVKSETRRRPHQPPERKKKRPDPTKGSIAEGRSIFHRSVKDPAAVGRLLVSGHNNVKIGRDVRIGVLKGYYIFTLSFEERATCPTSCAFWNECYGNAMPYAKRLDHRDLPTIKRRLAEEISSLLGVRGRKGILIRLHALGDFFSVEYVRFWQSMLAEHDRLAIYGYTAHKPHTEIGREIAILKELWGNRFAVRWSDGGMDTDCTVGTAPGTERIENAFICPEQLNLHNGKGQPLLCANCGLCWTTSKNVAFLEH